MNKRTILLAILHFFYFPQTSQNSLFEGLVNYWPIENHVNDTIGGANMYNGNNAHYTNDRFGSPNSALNLTNGFYQVPAGVYFKGNLTISFWIKSRVLVAWAKIVDFGNGTGVENVLVSASYASGGCPAPEIFNVNSNQRVISSRSLVIGAWTHFVFTLNGTLGSVYMDGVLTAQNSIYVPNNVVRSPNYIGKSHWPDGNLNADLDDLRFYNRSITLSEILQLWNIGTTSTSLTTSTSTSTTTTSTTTSSTTSTRTTSTSTSTTATTSTSTTRTSSPTSTLSTTKSSTSTSTTLITTHATSSSTTSSASTWPSTHTASSSSTTTITTTFSSAPITTGSSIQTMLQSINSTFEFFLLDPAQAMNLLNSYDLSGCLVNCTNNGKCKYNYSTNTFICSCFSNYMSGYACQIDTRPCSSNPCLNNGTCVDYSYSNTSSFYCLCDKYHKGAYCESEKDICQNETCSNNGNCFVLNKLPKCKCFNMYLGDKCESESNELKTVKEIISFSTILAIIIIVLFYSSFIFMDMSKFCCRHVYAIRHVNPIKRHVKRFIYYNH